MSQYSPLPAVIAYLIPVFGWLYVYFFQRHNPLALFHLRQAVGLVIFLVGVLLGWIIVAWLIAFIPFVAVLSVSLFAIVMAAYFFGFVVWVIGMLNASRSKLSPLPLIGQWANRLPIV